MFPASFGLSVYYNFLDEYVPLVMGKKKSYILFKNMISIPSCILHLKGKISRKRELKGLQVSAKEGIQAFW